VISKWSPSGCSSPGFLSGAICSSVVIELRRSCSPERHFRGRWREAAQPIVLISAWAPENPRKTSSPGYPGRNALPDGRHFEKSLYEKDFKIKNKVLLLTWSLLQRNYLQAFPISWDYPFNSPCDTVSLQMIGSPFRSSCRLVSNSFHTSHRVYSTHCWHSAIPTTINTAFSNYLV
jgi:hypothetical protein